MYRPRLTAGDADRSWGLVWSRDAAAGTGQKLDGPVLLLPRGGGAPRACPGVPFPAAEPVPFAEQVVSVPADAPPGVYALAVNGVKFGDVEVLAPGRKVRGGPTRIRPESFSEGHLERALARGPVILEPGAYTLSRPVELPAGADVTGWGAHLFGSANGAYGSRMFHGGTDATFRGLTFHPYYLAFHSEAPCPGLVLDHCTFASGILGYGYADVLVRDCTFDGGYVIYAPAGCYLRCRFRGGAPSSALMFLGSYPGTVAVIDCEFDRTRDALVVNTNQGSFVDNLIHGLRAYRIAGGANGNEVCSCEGNPAFECSRNLYLLPRVLGCASPMFISETTRRDEFVWGLEADGPSSIVLDGWGGCEVTGNTFAGYELRGGRVVIGARDLAGQLVSGKVARNVFAGRHVGLIPSRLNQPQGRPEQYSAGVVYGYSAEELQANDLTGVIAAGTDRPPPGESHD